MWRELRGGGGQGWGRTKKCAGGCSSEPAPCSLDFYHHIRRQDIVVQVPGPDTNVVEAWASLEAYGRPEPPLGVGGRLKRSIALRGAAV